MKKVHPFFLFVLGGFLFFLDRGLKHFAFSHQHFASYISRPWIGWEYFENPGVAFGIPLPWFAAFFYTPIIIASVLWYYKKKKSSDVFLRMGIILIFFGALSNLIDRILYHITIDYIRIFTSIINLADVMIVCGALLLLSAEIKTKNSLPTI